MATAPPPSTRPRQVRLEAPPPSDRWLRWLLLGLFFGLGYGLTQRLLEVRWGEGASKAPAFKATPPPEGTSLKELRRAKGDDAKPLAADLEELAHQQRQKNDKQEALKQENSPSQNAPMEEEKARLESDRQRLDAMGTAPEPTNPIPAPPEPPALPPPAPLTMEQPAPPASPPATEAPAPLP